MDTSEIVVETVIDSLFTSEQITFMIYITFMIHENFAGMLCEL